MPRTAQTEADSAIPYVNLNIKYIYIRFCDTCGKLQSRQPEDVAYDEEGGGVLDKVEQSEEIAGAQDLEK